MTLKDFEKQLQDEFKAKIKIVPHPSNEDMAGVYLEGVRQSICGCPSNEIYEERSPSYVNKYGQQHNSIPEVKAKVSSFLNRLENEKGFRELMNFDFNKK